MRATALASVALLGLVSFLASPPSWASESIPELSPEHARRAAVRSFDAEELATHDGSDPARPILMAVRGIVFDVSSGDRFYGAGAQYNALVGRDSSRAVARMSLEPADLEGDCDALDTAQWQFLAKVLEETYLAKYPIVGHLTGGYFFPDGLCCHASQTTCNACGAPSGEP